MKSVTGRVRESIDPKKLFYEGQKAKVRFVRLVEAFERLAGARPGPKLTVNFRGTERLEDTIRHAGTRLSLALAARRGPDRDGDHRRRIERGRLGADRPRRRRWRAHVRAGLGPHPGPAPGVGGPE